MRHITRLWIALLLIAVLAPACQTMTGQSAGRYLDDSTITAKVKSRLVGDKASNLTRVGVDTVNGTVSLTGMVDSVHDKVMAEEAARTVDGVRSVNNQLQIVGTGSALPR